MRPGEGKPGRRGLTAEEHKLWGHITRSVAPLQRQSPPAEPSLRATPGKAKPLSAPARSVPSASRPAPALETFDRRIKQRLARGTEPIERRVDLHGKTQAQAYAALCSFLRKAQTDGVRFALVITGKGAGAREEWSERGVLKRQVPHWLRSPELRGYVSGYEDAHTRHGGGGALYVRIRRQRSGTRRSPDL